MPARVNGIGTTYLGKKNLTRHLGVCGKCRRNVQLEDYETRLWFTVFFIPVIPLARRQIMDYCPSCSAHYAVPVEEWARVSEEIAAEGARKLAEKPTDAEAALEQLWTLVALKKRDEADRLAAELARRFPENVDVQLSVGAWWEAAGEDDRADAAFAKALALAPDNPAARRAVGIAAIDKGDLARARELLRFMEKPGPDQDVAVLAVLAAAYQHAQMHAEALEIFGIILKAQPRLSRDGQFRKLVAISQNALPMQEPVLPPWRLWQRRWFRWAAVAGVLLAILFGVNHMVASSRAVHVVNGLGVPVEVQIDGEPKLTVPAGGRKKIRIAEGQHEAIFSGPDGLSDTTRFAVSGRFVGRFFDGTVRVLNAFGSAVVHWRKVGYAATAAAAGQPQEKWHLGRPYVTVDDPDYVFEAMPRSVKTKKGSGVVYKTGISLIPVDSPARILAMAEAMRVASADQALRFAEGHVWTRPDDSEMVNTYLGLSVKHGQGDRCREFLARGLGRRPVGVEWHRAYQSVCHLSRHGQGLVAQYEQLLQADPRNSNLLYLLGRIQRGIRNSAPYMDRAIEANPRNPYPYLAKAYYAMAAGAFDEARRLADKAHEYGPKIPSMERLRFTARLAARDFDALEREARSAVAEIPESLSARERMMTVLVARGRDQEAQRQLREYQRVLRDKDPQGLLQAGKLARGHLLGLTGQYQQLGALARDLKDPVVANRWQLNAALGLGEWEAADRLLRKDFAPRWPAALLLSVAAHQADRSRAAQWRKEAIEELAQLGSDEARAAALLQAPQSGAPEATEDLILMPEDKAIVLVAMVQAGADKSLLDLARKLNLRPGVRQRVLDGAIRRLRR